ncbi:MAG: proline dehydrogenase [Ignavibacteriae bacterium HGW-Ignavibacteriae-4]|jgi:proline dehydrogenase|nr:MAG: proline dehydrogenase [Ignavibacteriae bacterium HGW-Ignavibacteriae-4]
MINKLITKTLPLFPKSFIYLFAKKYIAGATLEEAIEVCKLLEAKGACTTIDTLGEFVSSKQQATKETSMSLAVLDAIKNNSLNSYLSIKPTSLGLEIDFDFAYSNIKSIVSKAKELGLFVRLDMENTPYTSKTLDIYKKLKNDGLENVGFVIQAYLKRSMDDIKAMSKFNPSTRLCKGIYNESPSLAYKDREKIRDNYKELLKYMFENGYYTCIATHDDLLLNYAENLIKEKKIPKDKYEFQMLLGVTESLRAKLISNGHKVRVYTPYGIDWYGYSIRRLNENPQMAGHIVKSIFTRK